MGKLTPLMAALVAGLISLGAPAVAATTGTDLEGAAGGAPEATQRQPAKIDCSKSKTPSQCEARQKAREACHGKTGMDMRACMDDHMPPPDCSQTNNPRRCEAQLQAREKCRGKYGPERSRCIGEQAKPVKRTPPSLPKESAPAKKKSRPAE